MSEKVWKSYIFIYLYIRLHIFENILQYHFIIPIEKNLI